MALKRGKQTYLFQHPAAIHSFAAIGSKREGEGPLGEFFDTIDPDSTFGQKSWERAESRLHHDTVELAVKKAGLSYADLDCLLAGDLLNQCIGATFGVRELGIPYLGIYGACSNMAEGLLLSAFLAESGLRYLGVSTASHFCTAERQYRFPLEYGGQRTPTSQWTVTGGGAVVVAGAAAQTPDQAGPWIQAAAIGTIEDKDIKDAANMGAAMAPAAAATILGFLSDTGTTPEDYDLILTGDLGQVGSDLLYELATREGVDLRSRHTDCGLLIYDRDRQDVHAGGSGCGCCASVLCSYILPSLREGRVKRVLFAATGALLSPTSTQQGESIPSIAHAVCLTSRKEDLPWN